MLLESSAGDTRELNEINDQIQCLSDQISLLCDQRQQKHQTYKSEGCSISNLKESSKDIRSKANLPCKKMTKISKLIATKND